MKLYYTRLDDKFEGPLRHVYLKADADAEIEGYKKEIEEHFADLSKEQSKNMTLIQHIETLQSLQESNHKKIVELITELKDIAHSQKTEWLLDTGKGISLHRGEIPSMKDIDDLSKWYDEAMNKEAPNGATVNL